MTDDFVIPEEARKAARAAAIDRWMTGSSDSTQMLLALDAGLLAALPHLRAHQIERAHEEWEPMVRRLVDAELRHYGYTDEQIALANLDRPHTSDCEFDANHHGWVCTDENGKSFHPEWDEATDVAGVISRALEALLPTEAETKALAETATEVGRRLGRKEALEEVLARLTADGEINLGAVQRALRGQGEAPQPALRSTRWRATSPASWASDIRAITSPATAGTGVLGIPPRGPQ